MIRLALISCRLACRPNRWVHSMFNALSSFGGRFSHGQRLHLRVSFTLQAAVDSVRCPHWCRGHWGIECNPLPCFSDQASPPCAGGPYPVLHCANRSSYAQHEPHAQPHAHTSATVPVFHACTCPFGTNTGARPRHPSHSCHAIRACAVLRAPCRVLVSGDAVHGLRW